MKLRALRSIGRNHNKPGGVTVPLFQEGYVYEMDDDVGTYMLEQKLAEVPIGKATVSEVGKEKREFAPRHDPFSEEAFKQAAADQENADKAAVATEEQRLKAVHERQIADAERAKTEAMQKLKTEKHVKP